MLQLIPAEIPVEIYQWPAFQKEQRWGWVQAVSFTPKTGRLLVYVNDLVFEAKNITRDYFAGCKRPGEAFAQIRLDDLMFCRPGSSKICRLREGWCRS
jgi:hypothetical protein